MVELKVDRVGIDADNGLAVVILKEVSGDRLLPIWIGALEAGAIAMAVESIEAPRPMTHDLMVKVMEELGGSVSMVLVNALEDQTFYAQITVSQEGHDWDLEFDARPSDAIALALRFRAPIFATEDVLEQAGTRDDSDEGGNVRTVH